MRLKNAIELYEPNSYERYRKLAKLEDRVPIGRINVSVYKEKGIWCIDSKEFHEALRQDQVEKKKHSDIKKQNTADYAKGIIHGKDGDILEIEGGGYKIRGEFRFVWSDYEQARNKSSGTWYCNKCNILAETEHNKEECHLCNDWNGCGRDCTLSKVYCPKCGSSISV